MSFSKDFFCYQNNVLEDFFSNTVCLELVEVLRVGWTLCSPLQIPKKKDTPIFEVFLKKKCEREVFLKNKCQGEVFFKKKCEGEVFFKKKCEGEVLFKKKCEGEVFFKKKREGEVQNLNFGGTDLAKSCAQKKNKN